MNLEDVLLMFSEWMDTEGLTKGEDEGDDRTHHQLALDFLEEHEDVLGGE